MLRELKDFETVMMVGCTISEHFEQISETCNSLMIKLHKLKIVNDCMLLHATGMKLYEKLYRKVPGAIAKFFRCNTPAYAYPLFKTHKLSSFCFGDARTSINKFNQALLALKT